MSGCEHMRKPTSYYSNTVSERATPSEIEAMPALLDTYQYARITGESPNAITRRCANGELPAVKVGKAWRINKVKVLEALGL